MCEKNMSQKEKCENQIENLYRILRAQTVPPNPRFVIVEIMDTEKCQEWHDLKAIRDKTAEELMKERRFYLRMVSFSPR